MAKIAGRKNDGAWFRFNRWILAEPAGTQAAFRAALSASNSIIPAYAVIETYINKVGADQASFPATVDAWALELSIGVPLQLWMGVTTYDYYQPKGDGPPYSGYEKLMEPAIFKFSVDIRTIAKQIRFGRQEVIGLAGLTHPAHNSAQRKARLAMSKDERRAEAEAYWAEHGDRLMAAAKLKVDNLPDRSKAPVLQPRKLEPKGRQARTASLAST